MKKIYTLKFLLMSIAAMSIFNLYAQGWVKEIPVGSGIQFKAKTASNDNGFWAVGNISDTASTFSCQTVSGPSLCRRTGIIIQKYNNDGIKVSEKIIYSPNTTEGLQGIDVIDCPDNSGILLQYNKLSWSYFNPPNPYPDYYEWKITATQWAKLDYSGNILWSGKMLVHKARMHRAITECWKTTGSLFPMKSDHKLYL